MLLMSLMLFLSNGTNPGWCVKDLLLFWYHLLCYVCVGYLVCCLGKQGKNNTGGIGHAVLHSRISMCFYLWLTRVDTHYCRPDERVDIMASCFMRNWHNCQIYTGVLKRTTSIVLKHERWLQDQVAVWKDASNSQFCLKHHSAERLVLCFFHIQATQTIVLVVEIFESCGWEGMGSRHMMGTVATRSNYGSIHN